MALWIWIIVSAAGAAGQFVDAFAGMGFGAISSTVMVAGGLPYLVAISTVNLTKVGSGAISAASHWRFGNVRRSWLSPLIVSGVVGGVIGAGLITRLPADSVRIAGPVLLLATGLLILRRFVLDAIPIPRIAGASDDAAVLGTPRSRSFSIQDLPVKWRLSGVGLAAGVLNGMTGAFGPLATGGLLATSRQSPRYVVGTVSVVEVPVALAVSVTLLASIPWGLVDWRLPLALLAGSVVTAPLGAYLASRLPQRLLGVAVGVVLIGLNGVNIVRALV